MEPLIVQKQYPLLYWVTLAVSVGVPNFLHFDASGRTHIQGLFNATSISNIGLALFASYALAALMLLSREPLIFRQINVSSWLWVCLLIVLTTASILQPPAHLTPLKATDLPLSLFRLGEWTTVFLLYVALYTRSDPRQATRLMVQLIGRASWIWIGMVWILLPIIPSRVYGMGEEGEEKYSRLGGSLISPSVFGTLAIFAFFYSLLFFRPGLRRWLGCTLGLLCVILCHTRTEQAAFLLLAFLYIFVYSRNALVRMISVGFLVVLGLLALIFIGPLKQWVARGQSASSLATLDDRTYVWQAAYEAISRRPVIGYGFVVGAKAALRDYWKYEHWTPPHAHNDFIQAALAGGMFCLVIVIAIYGRVVWSAFSKSNLGPEDVFLKLVIVDELFRSALGTTITTPFSRVGAVFLLTYIGVVGSANAKRQADQLISSARRIRASNSRIPQALTVARQSARSA